MSSHALICCCEPKKLCHVWKMPKDNITFRCDSELKRELKRLAKASDIGLSRYIIGVLTNAVRNKTLVRERTTYEEVRRGSG